MLTRETLASTWVALIDDHPLVRQGLRTLIDLTPGFRVVAEADDEAAAIRAVNEICPDLEIVDISLRQSSRLDVIKWLHQNHPSIRILVASTFDEQQYGERAFRAGAIGFVNKQSPTQTIIAALRNVQDGKLSFSDSGNVEGLPPYCTTMSSKCWLQRGCMWRWRETRCKTQPCGIV